MWILLFSTIISVSCNALEVNSKNLKQLLEQNNSRVQAAQFQVKAAKEREGILIRSFLPSVKLSAGQETFKNGIDRYRTQPTYGVEGNLNLYNGGIDSFESEIRQMNSSLRTVQGQQVATLELQKVRTVYWEILYLKNKENLLKDAIEINKANSNSALQRINSGVATNTDRLEFDMEAVNLQREFNFNQIQLQNNLAMLQVLFNLDPNEELKFNEELVHEHEIDSKISNPQNFEFMYKDLELNSQINSLQSDQEKRGLWPKIDAFASYNQYNQRERDYFSSTDRDEYAFGIRVTLDIPSGFESNRESASYNFQAKSNEALARIQKREVEIHMKNEMNELNFLHEQVHNAEENIQRSDKYYRSTQSEYKRGVKNSPDVLVASQRLFEMKHKRLQIVRDFQIAKGHVLAQMGQ